jgi:hypothetical protein
VRRAPSQARIDLRDRIHELDDRAERLAAIVKDTIARGGKVVIPALREPGPMGALKATIESHLHWNVQTPEHKQQVELS